MFRSGKYRDGGAVLKAVRARDPGILGDRWRTGVGGDSRGYLEAEYYRILSDLRIPVRASIKDDQLTIRWLIERMLLPRIRTRRHLPQLTHSEFRGSVYKTLFTQRRCECEPQPQPGGHNPIWQERWQYCYWYKLQPGRPGHRPNGVYGSRFVTRLWAARAQV